MNEPGIGRIAEEPPLRKEIRIARASGKPCIDGMLRFARLNDNPPRRPAPPGPAPELLQQLERPFIRPEILYPHQAVSLQHGN